MLYSLDYFLEKIPVKCKQNVFLLEEYKGNRTKISFTFPCGCKVEQSLKAFVGREYFDACANCKIKPRITFRCKFCYSEYFSEKTYLKCFNECEIKYLNLTENKDFVICQICGFHGKSIKSHFNKKHNVSFKEYKNQFPNDITISDNCFDNYSQASLENGNWLQKAVENRDDLTEYWKKVSNGVRESIMNNPEERQRRAEVMSKVNKSDVMRLKASETAKKTSARLDIQKARALKLKIWRDENPEDFYEKCVKKMITSFHSKPERKLFEFVSNIPSFNFKLNQFINSTMISNKSHNKQIDIGDKEKRIYIEFDGLIHFKPFKGEKILACIKNKDLEIDKHITNHNWTLIRVSHDQFIYKTKMIDKVKHDISYFKQECLDQILEILKDNKPGVYKIGEVYEQH